MKQVRITVLRKALYEDLIARYENPIHFKPHGKYLFLIPQEVPGAIPGAEFEFSSKGTGTPVKLRIPDSATGGSGGTTYSLDNFLQYVQKKYLEYRAGLKDPNSDLFKMKNMNNPGPAKPIIETVLRVTELARMQNPEGGEN